ncbi:YHYH protein [Pseudofulvibacter geojedonensis]|uniref:YHYH protein n=1 Tax=Pseudofulvibacter geojedonensis TaxID=1123758 RepID=A0ABW3I4I0_9FLAO
MIRKRLALMLLSGIGLLISCSDSDDSTNNSINCTSNITLDTSRGACNETLNTTPTFSNTVNGNTRTITANNIPNHMVGLFGGGQGSLNPNAISAQSSNYTMTVNPTVASSLTPLLGSNGPDYSFGVLLNGIELDPIAAEPWPHQGIMNPNVNWEWNLEALNVQIGLDCNSAHVQPTGKYHYHGKPTLYLDGLNVNTSAMTLIGYAADGFPIYYKYAYSNAGDNTSTVVEMTSSYQLKTGTRPGDGVTAPCDVYTGVYSNDYEYVNGLGTLDEANGRTGVTPEYPAGTYYYVMTDDFPSIPRYFRGTPNNSFALGG